MIPKLQDGGYGDNVSGLDRVGARPQLPHLGDAGKGVHRKLPHLGDAGTVCVEEEECCPTSGTLDRKRPSLGGPGGGGRGIDSQRGADLLGYMNQLATRLRRARVCCGDWSRVLGPSVTFKHGITGVFLDPPYADTAKRTADLYASDSASVAHDVRRWAIENGDNRDLRIALCGYEGEHEMPDSWECVAWKARGGYSSQNVVLNENPAKERIWFSKYCLRPQRTLWDD